MKKFIFLFLGLVLFTNTSKGQSADKEIQQLRDAYVEAFGNSDIQGILEVYSENAVIHNTDGNMVQGSNEIKESYEQFFANSDASISFENISEDALADDMIFYHDKVFLKMDGEEDVSNIEVVNIAKKIDDKWRVIKSYRWPMPE